MTDQYDVIIIGAGAAGMMSAIEAGKRGRKVLLVDHYKKIGEKIRISGGGDVILLIFTPILISFFLKTQNL